MTDVTAEKKPAVFIDRDGTIIEQMDVLIDPAQVILLPGAAAGIAELNRHGFLVIGITNQPIMEKGLLDDEGLAVIHAELGRQLAEAAPAAANAPAAHLDAIYTCPHRYRSPEDSIPQCHCRKPDIGLIEDAERDFPIDAARSWFIGDRLRDIETGRRAGLRTILVTTGIESKDDAFFPDAKPDFIVTDLTAAAKIIK
jgi:D-glycero-D-manno-heptose 1,7-bisphosphate phosphatase